MVHSNCGGIDTAGYTPVEYPVGEGIEGGQYFAHGRGIAAKQPQFQVAGYFTAHLTLPDLNRIGRFAGATIFKQACR